MAAISARVDSGGLTAEGRAQHSKAAYHTSSRRPLQPWVNTRTSIMSRDGGGAAMSCGGVAYMAELRSPGAGRLSQVYVHTLTLKYFFFHFPIGNVTFKAQPTNRVLK